MKDKQQKIRVRFLGGLFIFSLLFAVGLTMVDRYQGQFSAKLGVARGDSFTCPIVSTKEFGVTTLPDKEKTERAAAKARSTTLKLLEKVKMNKSAALQSERQDIFALLKERKSALVEAMYHDQIAASDSLLAQQERSLFTNTFRNCVETFMTVEGRLEVMHSDFFEQKVGNEEYRVVSPDRKRFVIHPVGGFREALLSGMEVKVSGVGVDNEILVDGFSPLNTKNFLGGFEIIKKPGNPPVVGEQKTIVILSNFQNTTQPELSSEQVQDVIFNQVNSYYKENSYNNISLSGDIMGWYAIPIDQSCDDLNSIRSLSIEAADPTVYFPDFSRLVVIVPTDGTQCHWGGTATNDKEQISTDDGYVMMSTSWVSASYVTSHVIAHELGHNFGNHHASFLKCGDVSVSETGCIMWEYGDRYNVMGSEATRHFNISYKETMGWNDSKTVIHVFENGIFDIAPIELPSSGIQGLKLPRIAADIRGSVVTDFLTTEARQPIGFDVAFYTTEVDDNAYEGPLFHISDLLHGQVNTLLIDATPPSTDAYTPSIPVNGSFVDPASGAQITSRGYNESKLTLEVTLGKTDFAPPSAEIISPKNETSASGSISVVVSASDDQGISHIDFYASDSACYSYLYSSDCNRGQKLPPFAQIANPPYQAILDTTHLMNYSNYIWAMAYDTSGQSFQVPDNFALSTSISIKVYNEDSIPPTITLLSPTPNSFVANPVSMTAGASDNVGIAYVKFTSVNQDYYYSDYYAPYDLKRDLSVGKHSITATAVDFAFNVVSTSEVSFTVIDTSDTLPPKVSLMPPAQGDIVNGTVTIGASASDDHGISFVEFYKNESAIGTDDTEPYEFSWDTSLEHDGQFEWKAKAYDIGGNFSWSDAIGLVVDNTKPDVSITEPVDNVTVKGNQVTINASASDVNGVSRVEFYLKSSDSTEVALGKDDADPYSLIWDSTSVSNGSYTLSTKAYDTVENSNTVSIGITVENDYTPPIVSLTDPRNGAIVVGKAVSVSATASDNVAVDRVEFYLDNEVLIGTDKTSPYTISWDSRTVKNGQHTLYARAFDSSQNKKDSSKINVKVLNPKKPSR